MFGKIGIKIKTLLMNGNDVKRTWAGSFLPDLVQPLPATNICTWSKKNKFTQIHKRTDRCFRSFIPQLTRIPNIETCLYAEISLATVWIYLFYELWNIETSTSWLIRLYPCDLCFCEFVFLSSYTTISKETTITLQQEMKNKHITRTNVKFFFFK